MPRDGLDRVRANAQRLVAVAPVDNAIDTQPPHRLIGTADRHGRDCADRHDAARGTAEREERNAGRCLQPGRPGVVPDFKRRLTDRPHLLAVSDHAADDVRRRIAERKIERIKGGGIEQPRDEPLRRIAGCREREIAVDIADRGCAGEHGPRQSG